MMSSGTREALVALARESLRSGTIAGLAMIPFAAAFRASGLRINEYGRRTLELIVGEVPPPLHSLLTFVQHLLVSWVAAVPLLWLLRNTADRRARILLGGIYGSAFYVAVNSLALPLAFGDPIPWVLGFATVYPSLVVHLVYGITVALVPRTATAPSSRPPG